MEIRGLLNADWKLTHPGSHGHTECCRRLNKLYLKWRIFSWKILKAVDNSDGTRHKPFVANLKRCCPTSMAPPFRNDILKLASPSQPPDEASKHEIKKINTHQNQCSLWLSTGVMDQYILLTQSRIFQLYSQNVYKIIHYHQWGPFWYKKQKPV